MSKCALEVGVTSTQVAADRGALRIWRWVSLPEGGQKFWLQWQLAHTAWIACARVAATRSASKLHSRDPLHRVIYIRLIRWHGAHLQAVFIVMEILLPDPEKLPSSLWSRNLRVLPKLICGRMIAYAGDFNFYHNIHSLLFFRSVQFYFKKGN